MPTPAEAPKVALVHDWLVGQRGGEQVLLAIARHFPRAPIYTLVHTRGSVHPELERHPIITSAIAQLPQARRHFRAYLPLFFRAVEAWDLGAYDLVISTSHCVAKGVLAQPHQTHISYIHTPARYLWDQMGQYLPHSPVGRALLPLARRVCAPLRRWDRQAAQRPTVLLANSAYVAERIAHSWQRRAEVVHPPVDVDYFAAAPQQPAPPRRGWVAVSALVPYKRVDLAIDLANAHRLPLTVVGEGPAAAALRRQAGPSVTFVSGLSRAALRALYRRAQGFIFCGSEDFGIAPVEAMAAGCPVLGWARGGLLETVVDTGPRPTGVLFASQRRAAMAAALATFEQRSQAGHFCPARMRAQAARFSLQAFEAQLHRVLQTHAGLSLSSLPPAAA